MAKRRTITDFLSSRRQQTNIHLSISTKAEPQQLEIYQALNFNPDPIGSRKTIVNVNQ